WSLGGLLYAAVEGHPPYDKGSAIATLTAVMTEPLEPPTRAGGLEEVIYGLLEKDPAKRLDEPGARALLERAARDTDTVAETSSKTGEGTRTTVRPLVGGLASAAKAANGARKPKGQKGSKEPKESTEPTGSKDPAGQRAARGTGASETSDGRAGTGSSTASP